MIKDAPPCYLIRNQKSSNSWYKTGNNFPLLTDDNEQGHNRKPFRSTGMMNRSMRSEYASSSMPGFRTPSTVDSRAILNTNISMNYEQNMSKGMLSRLRKEINQLMHKKFQLLSDIKGIEGSKNTSKDHRSQRPLATSSTSNFMAEGGIIKFNKKIKLNYNSNNSSNIFTPSPHTSQPKKRHKKSFDNTSLSNVKPHLYKK